MLSTRLRPYQQRVVDKLDEQISEGKRSLVIPLPTGAGKTVIGAYLMDRARSQGLTGWFVTHTVILASQTVDRFAEYGLKAGLIQAANTRDEHEPILVTGVQTLQARDYANIGGRFRCHPDKCDAKCDGRVCETLYSESFPASAKVPQVLVIDECDLGFKYSRRVARKVLEDGGLVIGLTATPYSNFMSLSYESIVESPTMDVLTGEDEPLVPLRAWQSVEVYDMKSARTGVDYTPGADGEFTGAQLDRGFQSRVLGDVPEVWAEKTADMLERNGKPPQTMVIVSRKKEGRLIVDLLNERTDYKAELTTADDAKNGANSTDAIIDRWKSGETTFLVAIDKVGRGFDVPSALVLVLIRPIVSPSLLIQILGRVVRSDDGKGEARVIDCGGNFDRLMHHFRRHYYDGPQGFAFPKPHDGGADRKPRKCPLCGFALLGYPPQCPECKADLTQEIDIKEVDAEVMEVNLGPSLMEQDFWRHNDLDVDALASALDDEGLIWRLCLEDAALKSHWKPVSAVLEEARHAYSLICTPIDHVECSWRSWKKCAVAKTVPNCRVDPPESDYNQLMRELRCERHDHRPSFPGNYLYHIGQCLPSSPLPQELASLLVAKRSVRSMRRRMYEPQSVRCKCCNRFIPSRFMRTKSNKYGYTTVCPECKSVKGSFHRRCSICSKCEHAVRQMTQFATTHTYNETTPMALDFCDRCQPW